ncbi:hypothetical protein AMR74_15780 [Halorubrum tropicale]|uniref:Uncharacterized protein n=1 Tax=Halorubrum tropicale TaxID=1765655 RepID=A0A0M9AL35_9EURY|nr:hypothetical protein AMR74_15780 [Halorubrum tropicale]
MDHLNLFLREVLDYTLTLVNDCLFRLSDRLPFFYTDRPVERVRYETSDGLIIFRIERCIERTCGVVCVVAGDSTCA